MSVYYRDEHVTLHQGDALEVLQGMADCSVHAIVTDPQYGLTEHRAGQVAETVGRWLAGDRAYTPSGTGFMGKSWDAFVPPPALWDQALRVLRPGGFLLAFGATRTYDLLALAVRLAEFELRDSQAWIHGQGMPKNKGQLKPAFEPIVCARKPLCGTVAANVQEWGTGALNIATCRTRPRDAHDEAGYRAKCASVVGLDSNRTGSTYGAWTGERVDSASDDGRWPTNVVLDDTAAAELDEQSGFSKSPAVGSVARTKGRNTIGTFSHEGRPPSPNGHGDSGGASRFFPVFRYEPKAPALERPSHDGVQHPTCKPLALMRWLCRLACPPSGTVLDMFAGSGTTLEAARVEGFNTVGVEAEADYLPLIRQRLARVGTPVNTPAWTGHTEGDGELPGQVSIFDLMGGGAA